jgi:inorganic pyrophosphatase
MKFLKNLFDRRPKVTALIEMPQGSTKKIEIKNGLPIVDRDLAIPVPVSYGYIPGTLAEDGDPLDIFVVSKKYLDTGHIINVRVVGIFECQDNGVSDDKLLAFAENEEHNLVESMTEVAHYLMNYKYGFKILNFRSKVSLEEIRRYKT